jgi:hypothetical protein
MHDGCKHAWEKSNADEHQKAGRSKYAQQQVCCLQLMSIWAAEQPKG